LDMLHVSPILHAKARAIHAKETTMITKVDWLDAYI